MATSTIVRIQAIAVAGLRRKEMTTAATNPKMMCAHSASSLMISAVVIAVPLPLACAGPYRTFDVVLGTAEAVVDLWWFTADGVLDRFDRVEMSHRCMSIDWQFQL